MIVVINIGQDEYGQPRINEVACNNDHNGKLHVYVHDSYTNKVEPVGVMTALADFRRIISGVEVLVIPASRLLDLEPGDRSIRACLADMAHAAAKAIGLVTNANSDITTYIVDFDSRDNSYHVYLEFEE